MLDNDLALLKLSYCPFLNAKKILLLEQFAKNLNDVFQLSQIALINCGLDENTVTKFITWRKSINLINVLKNIEQEKINYITWHNPNYPILLKEIYNPPPIIYYRGKLKEQQFNNSHILAVVGTRKCSVYAKKIIFELLPLLIKLKVVIVSGLAYGVDSLSHECSLKYYGETWSVLGSGLNHNLLYPSENKKLANQIISSGGLIISELAPNYPASKFTFPQRNRLIAGLSHATFVVEAGQKSGALITARYALNENRDVLTVPGNIFVKTCQGNNNLIKAGAIPILTTEDLLSYFDFNNSNFTNSEPNDHVLNSITNEAEYLLYKIIKNYSQKGEKINSEFLYKKTKLDTAKINSTLTILELKNLISQNNGLWESSY